jgi:hypothetical protein
MKIASDISIWWVLPWVLISIAIAYWYYRNVPWLKEQSKRIQFLMRFLRSGVLFLIGLLLLGLIIESSSYREEKPVLITLIDHSTSMLNYKDSASVEKLIKQYQDELTTKYSDQFELVSMKAGAIADYSDGLKFNESKTNLFDGFEKIHEDFYNRNVGGVVLISDGNFNEGPNPTYAAEKISLTPVFSLLVGDTVKKKDQYIKNIAVNDVAFFRNQFPVEIDLEAIKIGKKQVTVSILQNGKSVASQKVSYSGNSVDFQHVSFVLNADKIGFQAYTVVVSDVENEYNYKNNKRTFYVEVIDSRSRVLVLAGAPHPDVSAIRQELEKDENLEIESHIVKDWNRDLKKVDLVVVHEPGFNMESGVLDLLMDKKIPVLFVIGPNASAQSMKNLGLGLTIPSGKQTDENQAVINSGFTQFEISQDLKKAIEFYPPLKTKFGDLKANGAEILAYQRIGGVQKKDPILFFLKKGGTKYGVIYGEGIWKWRVNEFARSGEQKSFNELISKIGQYLLVKQNTAALRVTFPKRFTKNEEVIVNASFYNESMEPITTPTIELFVSNDKGKKSKLQFGVNGNMYRLSMGKLAPGKYEWKATTKHSGKSYAKSGVFIVEDLDPELLVNSSNNTVLNQLADGSGGKVFELKKYTSLLTELSKRDDITSVSYREASFDGLIDYKWLFILLLLFLGLEWFLRRYLGAY